MTALGLAGGGVAFDTDVSELHLDSMSLALYGAYDDGAGAPRTSKTPLRPARGHSKGPPPRLRLGRRLQVRHPRQPCPHLERRYTTVKSVIDALLVHALIERQLRHAMAASDIAYQPPYHEDRG